MNYKVIITVEDFYQACEQISTKHRLSHILTCLLSRYGVRGPSLEYIRNLTFGDIDKDKKVILIKHKDRYTGDVVYEAPIDDYFIAYLDKWVPNWYSEKNRTDSVIGLNKKGLPKSKQTVYYSMLNFAKWLNIKSISGSYLLFNRQLDLLLDIRKTRKLSTIDFENVIRMFQGDTVSHMCSALLIEKYESLTGDNVLRKKGKLTKVPNLYDDTIIDHNAEAVVAKLMSKLTRELDWEIINK